ncbi:MAG: helix-hairpin-helix domain-containing protein [Bacteroidales bacterium]|nr:helix-hairpin-helix domain-containing protein [Bacteroidales bacterium]
MKKYIYTFVFFVCAIAISRHIVADLEQEERIWALEHQIEELKKESLNPETGSEHIAKMTASKDSARNTKASNITVKKTSKRYVATKSDVNKTPKVFDSQKFATPVLLELNTIDSATLTKIPGIGAKSASLIIKYRDQLGGYVSPYQIEEKLIWDSAKERMDEWCSLWLKADSALVRRINVNKAGFKEILRHPYISYEQTKALVNYRDKHQSIASIEVLYMLEEFSEDDIARLLPYLSF